MRFNDLTQAPRPQSHDRCSVIPRNSPSAIALRKARRAFSDQTTPKVTTELYLLRQPFKVEAHDAGTMTVNRLVVLIGSILGLIGIVAWIGELDLGLEESLPATVEQPSDSQRRD